MPLEKSPLCDGCGKSKFDAQLLRCNACKSRIYCSKQCQKNDWIVNNHKQNCQQIRLLVESQNKKQQHHCDSANDLRFSVRFDEYDKSDLVSKMDVVNNHMQHFAESEYFSLQQGSMGELQRTGIDNATDHLDRLRFYQNRSEHKHQDAIDSMQQMRLRNDQSHENAFAEKCNQLKQKLMYLSSIEATTSMTQVERAAQMSQCYNEMQMLERERHKLTKNIKKQASAHPGKKWLRQLDKNKAYGINHKFVVKIQMKADKEMLLYNQSKSIVVHLTHQVANPNHLLSKNQMKQLNKRKKGNRKHRNRKNKTSRQNNVIPNQFQTKISQNQQNENFYQLAEFIEENGFLKAKLYCFAYVDSNHMLHILTDQVLAMHRW